MKKVEIEFPDLTEAIMDGLTLLAQRALRAKDDVAEIIKDVAVLEEKDVYGNAITPKKPKPPKHPTNLPNAQLVGDPKEHPISMLDPSRFTTEQTGPLDAACVYHPPEYFPYVIAKRPWLLPDRINDDARHRIEMKMREYLEGGG